MIVGNINPNVVECPLVGRPSVKVLVLNASGTAYLFTTDHLIRASVFRNVDDDADEAIITKTSALGEVIVLAEDGYIYFALTTDDAALLSSSNLYFLRVDVIDAEDESTVICVQTYHIMFVDSSAIYYEDANMSLLLSTRFINTLTLSGYVGGSGYLDGVTTVGQSVPCIIEFLGSNGIEKWILETSTNATVSGEYQRGLDYNGTTNTKVWRRIA